MDTFNKMARLIISTRIKDSMVVGIVGGFLGTIVMDFANIILYKAKISEALYGHLSASMIFPTWKTRMKKNFLLGQIFHMGIGSLMGLPLVYVLKKTGKDHHIFKGIITGFGTWGLVHDLGIRAGIFRLRPGTTGSYYSTLFQNIIYGIISAQSIVTFADSSMFPENKPIGDQNQADIIIQ